MADKKSYKQVKEELGSLLESFESAQHDDVDQMLKDYDAAMKLIAQLEKQLSAASESLKSK